MIRLPELRLSFRMFVLAVLAGGFVHYRMVSGRIEELGTLRAQVQRSQSRPADPTLSGEVGRLRDEVRERRRIISDPDAGELLGRLSRTMQERGLGAPVLHAGQTRSEFGIVQSTLNIEFKGSLNAIVGVLRDLSAERPSWRLMRLAIERSADAKPDALSANMEVLTFASSAEASR